MSELQKYNGRELIGMDCYKAHEVDAALAAKDVEIERLRRAVEESRQFFVLLRHHADRGSQRMIDDALSLIADQSAG